MVIKNFKKVIIILLSICIAFFFAITSLVVITNEILNPTYAATEAGTAANPYLIDSAEELYDFLNGGWNNYAKPKGYFKLMCDIDYNDEYVDYFDELFEYKEKYHSFSGVFDGNGHVISGIGLNGTYTSNITCYYALFPELGDAHVKNLKIDGVSGFVEDLYCTNNGGFDSGKTLGIVAGAVSERCHPTISNCVFTNIGVYTGTEKGSTPAMEKFSMRIGAGYNVNPSESWPVVENCYFSNIQFTVEYESCDVNMLDKGDCDISLWLSDPNGQAKNCVAKNITNACWYEDQFNWVEIDIKWGKTETNCITDKIKKASEFNCSSVGGATGDIWYWSEYWGLDEYDNEDDSENNEEKGFPYLRLFMNWDEVNFEFNPANTADYSPCPLWIPKGATQTFSPQSPTSTKIYIYNQEVNIKPDDGYSIKSWDVAKSTPTNYIINLAQRTCSIVFESAIVNSEGSIDGGGGVSPSKTGPFTVKWGAELSASKYSGDGPFTLTYTFTDINNVQQKITYRITADLTLMSADLTSYIKNDVIIRPTLKKKTPKDVTFNANAWTNQTTSTIYRDCRMMEFDFVNRRGEESSSVRFNVGLDTIEYKANDGYTIVSVRVGISNNQLITYTENKKLTLDDSLVVFVDTAPLVFVSFVDAVRSDSSTYGEVVPANMNGSAQMCVVQGESIECVANEKTVTYKYSNGTNSYTTQYLNKPFFAVDSHLTSTQTILIETEMIIFPYYELMPCDVSFELVGEGVVEVLQKADYIEISGSGNIRNFKLGLGVKITISPNIANGNANYYIYTFTDSNVVVLELKIMRNSNRFYLSDTGLKGNVNEITLTESVIENDEFKIIPIISLKQYNIEMK